MISSRLLHRFLILGVLLAATAAAGCKASTQVSAELKNIKDSDATTIAMPIDNHEAPLEVESIMVPIHSVELGTGDALSGGSGNAQRIYSCDENQHEDECYVELIGPALQNLLGGTISVTEAEENDEETEEVPEDDDVAGATSTYEIEADTFTSVMVATCGENGQGYTARVKAQALFENQTYYTQSGTSTMTADQNSYDYTELSFNSCANYSILSKPVEVGDEAVTVNLYIDTRNLAGAIDTNSNPGSCNTIHPEGGGAQGGNGGGYAICLNTPDVAGHIGAEPPVIERYLVTNEESPNGGEIIGLYFDGDDPVAGYNRAYSANGFRDGLAWWNNSFKKAYLEGGKLYVTDYRGDGEDSIAGEGDFTIVDFPRLEAGETETGVRVNDGDGSRRDFTVSVERID